MGFVAQREVEVLREPVSFEETLLEAGSTLEYPVFGEFFMSIDAGEQPAQDVILLDNMRVERCLRRKIEDFASVDQSAFPCAQDDGMRSRHLEMSRLQSKAGSSLALPAVSLTRQNSASIAPSLCFSARKPRRLNTAPLPS